MYIYLVREKIYYWSDSVDYKSQHVLISTSDPTDFGSSHEKFDVWSKPSGAFQKSELAGQTGCKKEILAFFANVYYKTHHYCTYHLRINWSGW